MCLKISQMCIKYSVYTKFGTVKEGNWEERHGNFKV